MTPIDKPQRGTSRSPRVVGSAGYFSGVLAFIVFFCVVLRSLHPLCLLPVRPLATRLFLGGFVRACMASVPRDIGAVGFCLRDCYTVWYGIDSFYLVLL